MKRLLLLIIGVTILLSIAIIALAGTCPMCGHSTTLIYRDNLIIEDCDNPNCPWAEIEQKQLQCELCCPKCNTLMVQVKCGDEDCLECNNCGYRRLILKDE